MSTTMDWTSVFSYASFALLGTFCLIVGFALGARRAKAVKRRVLQELNAQSLELLDTKSSLQSLRHYASQHERKDRLLKLTLKRLQQAEARCRQITESLAQQDRKHYVDMARLRLDVVESRETAIKATDIARRATARLVVLRDSSLPVSNPDNAQFTKPKLGSETNTPLV